MSFSTIHATTIIPYDNLGHLSQSADAVVIAKVTENNFQLNNDFQFYNWNLKILSAFKGKHQKGDIIAIDGMSGASTSYYNKIQGDIHLEVGKTYLFFLDQKDNGRYRPMTLSYYVYELMDYQGKDYFVPTSISLDIHIEGYNNGIFVINPDNFSVYLTDHITNGFSDSWKDKAFIEDIDIYDFYPHLRAAPAHCSYFVIGGNDTRWNIFPSTTLKIYPNAVDADLSTSDTQLSDAISDMASSYAGTNLAFTALPGSAYAPDCTMGEAQDIAAGFITFSNGLNSGNSIVVMPNDPCEQITDLSACSGTLAVGGLYGLSSTHSFDGATWTDGKYGYVIVNDGTGACLTATNYKIMLIHELTHSLSVGHIPTGSGSANMNPTCCNTIQALDIQCLDYVYPVPSVPVDWAFFEGKVKSTFNELKWATYSEINADYFVVEKSTDGIYFTDIGNVLAQGNSNSFIEYRFEDKKELDAVTYYRLRQVDFDGRVDYSELEVVNRITDYKLQFDVYPNPGSDRISFLKYFSADATIDIFGTNGKILDSYQLIGTQLQKELDVQSLPVGLYYIKVTSSAGSTLKSFMKI